MTYWLILFPGPLRIPVTREQFEIAATDKAPLIEVPGKGSFVMHDKYVFKIEKQQVACVVGRAENKNYSSRTNKIKAKDDGE